MATALGRWLVGSPYRDIIGADDPPGAPPLGDFILAGPGNDFLIADIGADVFGFNPGDGWDYLAQFRPGEDKLQFGGGLTAASLTMVRETHFGLDGTTIYYQGPNGTNSIILPGVLALGPADIEFGPMPGIVPEFPPHDFNNDLRSDLVLRDPAGQVSLWRMDGATVADRTILGTAGAGWTVIGAGDFNANGTVDLALQAQDGRVQAWSMSFAGTATPFDLPNPGPDWRGRAVGHFDDDPGADILFQHADGRVAIWQMGGFHMPEGTVAAGLDVASPGPDWTVVATGDLNGDYQADILLQHADGRVAQWLMNGATVTAATILGTAPGGGAVAGTADLDGNGRDEVLLRQANGALTLWTVEDGRVAATTELANPGAGWDVTGTGDYNGDGKDDILLRQGGGTLAQWQMDGARIAAAPTIAGPAGDWQVL